ncbi:hypothetical protein [Sphingorhabdus sp. M41]|uniref:hypothetical protein n=1 Tax=Sphingorhabdus sp. M41 TaxID=1806885 RepID=UPI00078BF214|nr:hypothetical protein [Sphingorhabdus sp. M41]AMO72869.1 hypothetical protein AZE99_14340 [Sphingorhabdus sp. M41]
MTKKPSDKTMHFEVLDITGDEHVAWLGRLWKRPDGNSERLALYKLVEGKLNSCRDFYAVPADG